MAYTYTIDVSLDPSFTTFVGVYHDYAVSGLSLNVKVSTTGTYYYRLRKHDGDTLTTEYSNPVAVTNGAPPVTITYTVDVSLDPSFLNYVRSYHDYVVNGMSLDVTGLGVGYYYCRIRKHENGVLTTAYSNIRITVVGSQPTALYKFDVSKSQTFNTYVTGYQAKDEQNFLSDNFIGGSNTTYYYRVRAYNALSESANSNTITVTTLFDDDYSLVLPPRTDQAIVGAEWKRAS